MTFAMWLLWSVAWANPYSGLVSAMTPANDYAVGRDYANVSLYSYGKVTDTKKVERAESIARKIVASSDRPDLVYQVIVLADPTVNASALPGGFLLINEGALDTFTDDQLAFVLGHEIAHVLLRHYDNAELLRVATSKLSVAQKAVDASDLDAALAAGRELDRMIAQHSKELELEADLYGLLFAARAGYPVASAPDAMRRLRAVVGEIPAQDLDWAHHPDFATRVRELEKAISGLRAATARFDAGVHALQAGYPAGAVDAFSEFLTLFPHSASAWGNLAAAHLAQGLREPEEGPLTVGLIRLKSDVTLRDAPSLHFGRARDACTRALKLNSSHPECLGMLGVMARAEGHLDEAGELLDRALKASPKHAALLVNRGNVHLSKGQTERALERYQQAAELQPELVQASFNAAYALEKLDRTEEAKKAYSALRDRGVVSGPVERGLKRVGGAPEVKVEARPALTRLGQLSLGDGREAVDAALGTPTHSYEDDAGFYAWFSWDDKGVEVALEADAVVSIAAFDASDYKTSRGLGLGATTVALVDELGEPTERIDRGPAGSDWVWLDRGVVAGVADGKVTWLEIYRTE